MYYYTVYTYVLLEQNSTLNMYYYNCNLDLKNAITYTSYTCNNNQYSNHLSNISQKC